MTRLGVVQTLKEVAQWSAYVRGQGRKALTGSGLDERAANHQVDFAPGFALGDQATQALGIAAGSQALRHHAQAADELGDLLVVAQFLAGQARHFIGQIEVFRVREHQRQSGRRRLLFAIGVIDQQHVPRSAGHLHPGRGSGNAQQGMREGHALPSHAGVLNAAITSSSS